MNSSLKCYPHTFWVWFSEHCEDRVDSPQGTGMKRDKDGIQSNYLRFEQVLSERLEFHPRSRVLKCLELWASHMGQVPIDSHFLVLICHPPVTAQQHFWACHMTVMTFLRKSHDHQSADHSNPHPFWETASPQENPLQSDGTLRYLSNQVHTWRCLSAMSFGWGSGAALPGTMGGQYRTNTCVRNPSLSLLLFVFSCILKYILSHSRTKRSLCACICVYVSVCVHSFKYVCTNSLISRPLPVFCMYMH